MKHDLRHVGSQFDIPGDFVSAAPYGSGHINDTYAATYNQGGTAVRYILQRINHHVFKQPLNVMQNIERVTGHLRRKLLETHADDVTRRTLTLIPTRSGESAYQDAKGNTWRSYIFIEHAATYDVIETPQQAHAAAKAYGRFQDMLSDLPGPRLNETIHDFHNTPARYAALIAAIEADPHNRAAMALEEIDFVHARESMVGRLLDLHRSDVIPERITHNDTKLNNVMLDDRTSEGVCVIDLDTVMPGLVLYDFGDMVRSATNPAREDERQLDRVNMLMPIFEALTRGYCESAESFLLPAEKENLVFSARLMTLELGIRFLTDFLEGDVYFKTHREDQNLDRCRVQFKMVDSFEQHGEAMETFTASL